MHTHKHTQTHRHACMHARTHTHTPSDTGAKKRSGSGTCWRWTIQPQERGREGHANARTHTGNGRYSSVTRQRWGHAQTYSDAHICTQTHIQIRKPPRQQHGVSLVPARRENGKDGYIHRRRLKRTQAVLAQGIEFEAGGTLRHRIGPGCRRRARVGVGARTDIHRRDPKASDRAWLPPPGTGRGTGRGPGRGRSRPRRSPSRRT
jgi:hypothetical protein